MQFKLLMGAALSAVLFCFLPAKQITVVAEPYRIVFPLYEIGENAWSELCINGSTASCDSYVDGDSAVMITAEQYLQKQGILWIWSTYDGTEWTETEEASFILMSNTKSGLTRGKYRLKTVFTLTDQNGKTETIKVYSEEVTVD